MSVKNREIDENGYVIIEPLIQVDIDKNLTWKNTTGITTGNTIRNFWVSKLNVPFVDVALQKKSSRDTSSPASVSDWEQVIIMETLKIHQSK